MAHRVVHQFSGFGPGIPELLHQGIHHLGGNGVRNRPAFRRFHGLSGVFQRKPEARHFPLKRGHNFLCGPVADPVQSAQHLDIPVFDGAGNFFHGCGHGPHRFHGPDGFHSQKKLEKSPLLLGLKPDKQRPGLPLGLMIVNIQRNPVIERTLSDFTPHRGGKQNLVSHMIDQKQNAIRVNPHQCAFQITDHDPGP